MSIFQAIIIAIIEGLTEFLPVSSTGHMILAQGFLGVKSDDFVKAFTVIIQFGAIISVIVLYWKRFFQLKPIKIFDKSQVLNVTGFSKWMIYLNRFLNKYDFYWKLFVAFLPAAVIGFLAGDHFGQEFLLRALALAIGMLLHISTTIIFESTPDHRFNAKRFVTVLAGAALAFISMH